MNNEEFKYFSIVRKSITRDNKKTQATNEIYGMVVLKNKKWKYQS